MTVDDEPPFKDPDCICPHRIGSAGRLYRISLGYEWHRVDTNPECSVHAPRNERRNYYLDARASMEACGIDPDSIE